MASKGQSFRKWSKEEKLEIIQKNLNDHISTKELARQYEMRDNSMICKWIKAYEMHGESAFESKRKGNPFAAIHTSKTMNETDRLRLIIAKQEVEIERLKKGYRVKGAGAEKEYATLNEKNMKS